MQKLNLQISPNVVNEVIRRDMPSGYGFAWPLAAHPINYAHNIRDVVQHSRMGRYCFPAFNYCRLDNL